MVSARNWLADGEMVGRVRTPIFFLLRQNSTSVILKELIPKRGWAFTVVFDPLSHVWYSWVKFLSKASTTKWKCTVHDRLQERFVAPSTAAGSPCPAPSFPGDQEFFRDFILAAESHVFNQHLSTTIVAKITQVRNVLWKKERSRK